jgi:hypothetical protein
MYSNKAPLFKGDDYSLWNIRMKNYLLSLVFDVWQYVENCYPAPATPPTDTVGKNICNEKSRAVNAILGGLTNPIFVKVLHCNLAKEIWDKLEVKYEGDRKVKESILQTYIAHFENLNMEEEENIVEYLHRVDEVVNSIKEA